MPIDTSKLSPENAAFLASLANTDELRGIYHGVIEGIEGKGID